MSSATAATANLFRPGDVRAPPSAKLITFVRHGQSTHNVDKEYTSPKNIDAPLTPLGEEQCHVLDGITRDLDCELIVTSPLTRTVHTAMLGFKSLLAKGVPLVAEENCRETVNYLCDSRRATSDLAADFPHCDFSRIESESDPVWQKYQAVYGSQDKYDELRESRDLKGVTTRKILMYSYLASQPQQSIAVVTHGSYLSYVFKMPGSLCQYVDSETEEEFQADWDNCEVRRVLVDFDMEWWEGLIAR